MFCTDHKDHICSLLDVVTIHNFFFYVLPVVVLLVAKHQVHNFHKRWIQAPHPDELLTQVGDDVGSLVGVAVGGI